MATTEQDTQVQIYKKHTAIIHAASILSFLERKLLNALNYHAFHAMPVTRKHRIDLKLACVLSGFNSNDIELLKNSARSLAKTAIEWDYLSPDGKDVWAVSTLLASVEISQGVIEYEYSEKISDAIYNPEMFGLVNMALQRTFTSKYSLILYENCVRFKKIGTTGVIPIEKLRKLLGVEGKKSYEAFGRLNDLVLKPAIKEINRFSEINIKMIPEKVGRKVVGVRFAIKENKQISAFGISEDEVIRSDIYKELTERGISDALARKSIMEHGEDYIRNQLSIVDDFEKKGKIKENKTGLTIKALEQGYNKPTSMVKEERIAKAKKKNDESKRKQERTSFLEGEVNRLQKEYRKSLIAMIESVFENLESDERDSIVSEFLEQSNITGFILKDFKKLLWNSLMCWSEIRTYWEEVRELPFGTFEEFGEARGLEKIKKELSKLQA